MDDPARLYLIGGEFPDVWVEGEVLSAWLSRNEQATHDEKWILDQTSSIFGGIPTATEALLRSVPGGPQALAAWRAGDYSLRAEVLELREMLDDAEQEEVDAMSPADQRDWAARRWGH